MHETLLAEPFLFHRRAFIAFIVPLFCVCAFWALWGLGEWPKVLFIYIPLLA